MSKVKIRWKEVKILSEINAIEHLLHQGYPREMIDIVLESHCNEPTPATDFNALNMLVEAAI